VKRISVVEAGCGRQYSYNDDWIPAFAGTSGAGVK